MNRFFSLLKRAPILIPFLLIMFFFVPPALLMQPEVERNAIVAAVGIDKENDEYTMSFLRFVPQANSNYTEQLEVLTCKAKTVSENLENASVILGKNLNLNHVESIILGKSVLEEDIAKILDFFERAPIVLPGCLLAGTNEKASDVIKAIQSLNDESGLKIEDILRYSEQHFFGRETTLESFYSGYYSPTSTSIIGYVEMLSSEENGLKVKGEQQKSGGEDSQESGTGTQQKEQKSLSNSGKLLLMKKGKIQSVLSKESVRGLNYVNSNSTKTTLSLTDYDLGEGKLADIIFEIVENTTIMQARFVNGIPVVNFDIQMKLDLYEVLDKYKDEKQSLEQYDLDEKITGEIEKVVKNEFALSLKILRETKTDPLEIYELLMKSDRKKFKVFLNKLDDKEDFMSFVNFAVNVESNPF